MTTGDDPWYAQDILGKGERSRMDNRDYLSCAETAALLRAALKAAFPKTKFSVRSHTYSGGASIDVKWTDGPTTQDVNGIAKRYEGADFDGMIDLKTYSSSWLLPDGSVEFASTPGTEGSRGTIPAVDNPKPDPDARLVHFGADFVFTERVVSPVLLAKAKEYAEAHPIHADNLFEGEIIVYVPDEDRIDPYGAQSHRAPPERAYAWLADHARISA